MLLALGCFVSNITSIIGTIYYASKSWSQLLLQHACVAGNVLVPAPQHLHPDWEELIALPVTVMEVLGHLVSVHPGCCFECSFIYVVGWVSASPPNNYQNLFLKNNVSSS